MNEIFAWKPGHATTFIAIITVSIGFAIYWFLSISEKIKSRFFNKGDDERSWVRYIVFQKLSGALFMGVIPAIIMLCISDYTLPQMGLKLGDWKQTLMYTGIIGTFIAVVNFFASKNPFNLSMYPQMRIKRWTGKRVFINAIAWATYMIGYEFMYRGIFLTVCVDAFGFWPAVAVNLSFYSATHIAKGKTETIGTFPYGLVLCYITVATGSIGTAFLTHLTLALTNDYYSIHHNPEMHYE